MILYWNLPFFTYNTITKLHGCNFEVKFELAIVGNDDLEDEQKQGVRRCRHPHLHSRTNPLRFLPQRKSSLLLASGKASPTYPFAEA